MLASRDNPTIIPRMIEPGLRANLVKCAEAFAASRGVSLFAVGKDIALDRSFFKEIQDDSRGFTARKYDAVMQKFSEEWPEGCDWPENVPRPAIPTVSRGVGETVP